MEAMHVIVGAAARREEPAGWFRRHVAPTDVRYAESRRRGKLAHPSRQEAETLVPSELLALIGEELHAEADAEHRDARLRGAADRLDQPLLAQTCHAVAEGADAGQEHRFRAGDVVARGARQLGDADARQGPAHRGEIADLHVDQDRAHGAILCAGLRSIGSKARCTSPLPSKAST